MLVGIIDANNAIDLAGDVNADNINRAGFDRYTSNFAKVAPWEVLEVVVASVAVHVDATDFHLCGLIHRAAELAVAAIA